MIYNDKHILIFPPKCGATLVIKHLISTNQKWNSVSDFKTLSHSPFVPESNQKKVVMLIRNPYERIVSMYEYFIRRPDILNNIMYTTNENYLPKEVNFLNFIKQYSVQIKYEKTIASEEKNDQLKNLERPSLFYNVDFYNNLRAAFLRSLKEYKEICNPSHFIKFENLDGDFKEIGIETSIPKTDKPWYNVNTPMKNYYTEEVLQYCDSIKQDAIEFDYEVIE